MAYGYARASRQVGVCFGNPGPGTTNMVSGLLEATRPASRVALCNGTVSRFDGAGALQELDVMTLMRPVTKWSSQLRDPAAMPWLMRRAFHLAVQRPAGLRVPRAARRPRPARDRDRGLPLRRPAARARPRADDVEALADALAASRGRSSSPGRARGRPTPAAPLRALAETSAPAC